MFKTWDIIEAIWYLVAVEAVWYANSKVGLSSLLIVTFVMLLVCLSLDPEYKYM